MNKSTDTAPASTLFARLGDTFRAPAAGNALAVAAGLLFLGLCMVLPLVGKAASGGSGSPGAEPLPSFPQNVRFFWTLWFLAALVTGAALANKAWRWRNLGEPFPRLVAALAVLLLALGLAQAAGILAL